MEKRITIGADGRKYRGCNKDCNGCIYQVKTVIGRQHGCNLCWKGDYSNCPINHYWTEGDEKGGKQMTVGDIIIRDKSHRTELKYRITRVNKIGDILLLWGLRVKYDNRINDWVSFGQERALLARDHRLLTDDDYHYLASL